MKKKKKETLVRRLDVSETNQMEEEEEDEKEKDEMNYPNKKKTLYVPMAIPYTYSHASAKNIWDTYTKNQSEKTHGHLSKLIKI